MEWCESYAKKADMFEAFVSGPKIHRQQRCTVHGSEYDPKVPGTILGSRSAISEHVTFFHGQIMHSEKRDV